MAIEISTVPVISTGNLSPGTSEHIAAVAPGPCIGWEYGWWLWVPIAEFDYVENETPADLIAALELAR